VSGQRQESSNPLDPVNPVNEKETLMLLMPRYILYVYTSRRNRSMTKAKIFKSGNSQAVRLPKEFQFEGSEVYIKRVGRSVVLIPKDAPWDLFEHGLEEFTPDFMAEGRLQLPAEKRETF